MSFVFSATQNAQALLQYVLFFLFFFFVEGLWSPDFVVVVFGQTEGTRSVGMTAVESVLLTEMLLWSKA